MLYKVVFHTRRYEDAPISLAELCEQGDGGRSIWLQNGSEERELSIFDKETGQVLPLEEFRQLQRARAEERRKTYRGGRRKQPSHRRPIW